MMNTDLVWRDVTNQNLFEILQKLLNALSVMMSRLLGVQHSTESQIDISIKNS